MKFKDRRDGGKKLAKKLEHFRGDKSAIILGLPRGGVVTADEVSKVLGLPLDILVTRKIGAPGNEEYAVGAITDSGLMVRNEEAFQMFDISQSHVDAIIKAEKKEAERRLKKYRGEREVLNLEHMTAIIVDDGVATGSTMRAAIKSAKEKGAKKVVIAVPVIAKDTLSILRAEVDEVVHLSAPVLFMAVGQFYLEFDQTEDDEVVSILGASGY